MLTISKNNYQHFSVFLIDGRVDADGAHQLQEVMKETLENETFHIILDLSKTDYLNSSGLRIFADTLTRCREQNGDLRLVAPNAKILRLLEIIGFTRFFKIYPDINAATDSQEN